jgi:hypothetical protein
MDDTNPTAFGCQKTLIAQGINLAEATTRTAGVLPRFTPGRTTQSMFGALSACCVPVNHDRLSATGLTAIFYSMMLESMCGSLDPTELEVLHAWLSEAYRG